MKIKIFNLLLFIVINVFLVSCEGESDSDPYVGECICEINGQTLLLLPSGKKSPTNIPTMIYPTGSVLTVSRTGEDELTLTMNDLVMTAHVNPEGRLTIPKPDVPTLLVNEHHSMSLDSTKREGYITSNSLFIKQESIGTYLMKEKEDEYTLTVINTQFFDCVKK